jgi:stress response protein YsnF
MMPHQLMPSAQPGGERDDAAVVRVLEEEVHVRSRKMTTGAVGVRKEVVTETQMVDVVV